MTAFLETVVRRARNERAVLRPLSRAAYGETDPALEPEAAAAEAERRRHAGPQCPAGRTS